VIVRIFCQPLEALLRNEFYRFLTKSPEPVFADPW
jgi:hypothetical protein